MLNVFLLCLSVCCFAPIYGNEKQNGMAIQQDVGEKQLTPAQVALSEQNIAPKIPLYINIFAHGLTGNANNLKPYKEFLGGIITGKNGPEWDERLYGKYAGPLQSSLAQEKDIAVVADQMALYPHARLILSGVSKGAATMINTVGWLAKHNPILLRNLQAVVVESPFDCMENVAANMVHTVVEKFASEHLSTSVETTVDSYCVRPLVKYIEKIRFRNFDPEGITPIKAVRELWQGVDKELVVVFVHSQEDTVISVNASRMLYIALKEQGFKNLYFLETEKGAHANVFWGADKENVLEQLCYIYLHHNLPLPYELSADYAEQLFQRFEVDKEKILFRLQPTIDEVNTRVHPWLSKVIGPKGFRLLGYVR